MLRVDTYDEREDIEDVWIQSLAHARHQIESVEILVKMFSSREYDLLLTFSADAFSQNQLVIDSLHTGDIIEFTGHVTGLSH